MRNKAIFLDRDGVINNVVLRKGKPHPPESLADLIIPDEVFPALNQLKALGFLLIVVTNQPDVARGTTPQSSIDEIHQFLLKQLPLDDIRVCYHDDADLCVCRKPKSGLLLQAAKDYNIELSQSYMIGDRWRDIEAGKMAGCISIFLDYGYLEKQPESPDFIAKSLKEAVEFVK